MTLDLVIKAEKDGLAAKLLPLIQEFAQETGLLVRSAEPHFIEVTTMDDSIRKFICESIVIHTDVDIRGISNRKMEGYHA